MCTVRNSSERKKERNMCTVRNSSETCAFLEISRIRVQFTVRNSIETCALFETSNKHEHCRKLLRYVCTVRNYSETCALFRNSSDTNLKVQKNTSLSDSKKQTYRINETLIMQTQT